MVSGDCGEMFSYLTSESWLFSNVLYLDQRNIQSLSFYFCSSVRHRQLVVHMSFLQPCIFNEAITEMTRTGRCGSAYCCNTAVKPTWRLLSRATLSVCVKLTITHTHTQFTRWGWVPLTLKGSSNHQLQPFFFIFSHRL